MSTSMLISIISIVTATIIGVRQIILTKKQIKLSEEQNVIKSRLDKIETNISQSGKKNSISGIVGNSNAGDISGNTFK